MTLRELHEITPPRTRICVGLGGNCKELNRGDPLELEIFGAYAIGKIVAVEEDEIEADIKMIPVKE